MHRNRTSMMSTGLFLVKSIVYFLQFSQQPPINWIKVDGILKYIFFWFGEVKIRKNTTISKKYGDPRKNMVKYFEFIWWRTLEVKLMKNIGAAERYLWVNEMSFTIALISISVNEDKGKLRTDRSIWNGLLLTLPLNCGDVASWGGRRMIYSDSKMNCCFFFPIVIDMVKCVNRVCLAALFSFSGFGVIVSKTTIKYRVYCCCRCYSCMLGVFRVHTTFKCSKCEAMREVNA